LIWGAAWLHKASNDQIYWNFVKSNIQSLESSSIVRNFNGVKVVANGGGFGEFGWDTKNAGINVLVSQVSLPRFSFYRDVFFYHQFNLTLLYTYRF
jgi:hypothetical protein